ncbi:hypothetical protein AB0E01_40500 [Nocardia vinacea]|uniref:hypothetical protein n=1 Tax=Nocardia vinacea TaxID=96468 RepID=UPI0033D4CD70
MPYHARVSDESRERLAELAALLRGCRDACSRIGEDRQWAPHPDSVCATDLATFAGHPSVRDDRLVLDAVTTYLDLAAAHCGGLAGLCDTSEVVVSPWPLTRSILENCARTVWILGGQPSDEPASNRLARAYIDNDRSAEYQKRIVQYLWGKQCPAYRTAKTRFERLRAEIRTVFPPSAGVDFNRHTINGQVCPAPTDTVLWFFDLLAKSGSLALDTKAPTAIYDLLSTPTHPTLESGRRRRVFVRHGDRVDTVQTIHPAEIEWLTHLVVIGIYDTLSSIYRYCGWEFDPDHRFEALIARTLPHFLRPTRIKETL